MEVRRLTPVSLITHTYHTMIKLWTRTTCVGLGGYPKLEQQSIPVVTGMTSFFVWNLTF